MKTLYSYFFIGSIISLLIDPNITKGGLIGFGSILMSTLIALLLNYIFDKPNNEQK